MHVPQVVAVQVQQVERDEIEIVLALGDRLPQLGKFRMALLVENDHFAIDDHVLNIQPLGCLGQVAILGCPIKTPLGEDANLLVVDEDLRAVAVEF